MKTPQQIKADFIAHGINISQWCRENGLSRNTVNDLLRGRLRGNRGQSHQAAIALGLKPSPTTATDYHTSKTEKSRKRKQK